MIEHQDAVNAEMAQIFCAIGGRASLASTAAAYTALAPGGRLRPLLFLAGVESAGRATTRAIIRGSCAFELIHSASLILDDLPCMDNTDERRGRSACHRQFGSTQAILAAFTLLHSATEELLTSVLHAESQGIANSMLDKLVLEKIAHTAVKAASGQLADLQGSTRYLRVCQQKTSALFEGAVSIGALLFDDSRHANLLQSCARYFGIAYQLQDDLIDDDSRCRLASDDVKTSYLRGRARYQTALRTCMQRAGTLASRLDDRGTHIIELVRWAIPLAHHGDTFTHARK